MRADGQDSVRSVDPRPGGAGRFILGDPSLLSFNGHCHSYLASISRPLRQRGYGVETLGNRAMTAELRAATSALPIFTFHCDERPAIMGIDPDTWLGRKLVRRAHETSVRQDLADADRALGFGPDDVLVLNTFRHWGLRGIVEWADGLGSRAPWVVLILHFTAFPAPETDKYADIYRDAFRRIEQSPIRDRFVMMADAEGLITEFASLCSLDFFLAPIPHGQSQATASDTRQGNKINIVYVGEARYHKGFHLLPWMINGMGRGPHRDAVTFSIQNFCANPRQLFYREAMATIDPSSTTFISEPLDEAGYRAFIACADIVVLPYLLDHYYVQSSGIYADAVAAGKPVVASRGTWVAMQIGRYGGGLTFPPNDAQGLLEACSAAVSDYDGLRRRAGDAAPRWNEFHNPERFIDIVLARAGKISP